MNGYKFFDHTADVGVEITGRTKKGLFANAVRTMFAVLLVNKKDVRKTKKGISKQKKIITVKGKDTAELPHKKCYRREG
ncbi:MAG: archease [Syntrophaceae bacterium]|nr:archease [Syntrophaceae bacterium]